MVTTAGSLRRRGSAKYGECSTSAPCLRASAGQVSCSQRSLARLPSGAGGCATSSSGSCSARWTVYCPLPVCGSCRKAPFSETRIGSDQAFVDRLELQRRGPPGEPPGLLAAGGAQGVAQRWLGSQPVHRLGDRGGVFGIEGQAGVADDLRQA